VALDSGGFFFLADEPFLEDLEVRGWLDADDEIHAFFGQIVEVLVIAAEVPVADLDVGIICFFCVWWVFRRGFFGAEISPLLLFIDFRGGDRAGERTQGDGIETDMEAHGGGLFAVVSGPAGTAERPRHPRQGGENGAVDDSQGELAELGGVGTGSLRIEGACLPRGLPGLRAGFAAELGDDGQQHFLGHMGLRL
jgi:hypothetical protein